MTEVRTSPSVPQHPSSPSAYYGLATQLRTPPADFSPTFPMTKSLSNSSISTPAVSAKKVTPAMRDEFGFAPKYVPAWSSKDEMRGGDEDVWTGSEEGSPSLAARTSPKHPRTSTARLSSAHRPSHTPHASESKHRRNDSLRDTPVFGKIDFNFKPMQQPLDLLVTLDPIQSTTYESASLPRTQRSLRIDEEDESASTGELARGASLNSNNRATRASNNHYSVNNKVSPSLGSPIVRSAPTSPIVRPPPPTIPDSFAAAFPLSRTITPASKNQMNLITLARRTTHLADVPGYGWRLNLLEKLEVLTGSFIAIRDAESILSIGKGQKRTSAQKLESRKSQIFLPTTTSPGPAKLHRAKPNRAAKVEEPKTFLGRMKRALSNPGQPQPKEVAPPVPAPKRVVFGQKLSQIADYAFVTSMIAGQRHDLSGVCFSTVEEIYRRGQGSKVPGLLQLAGEPGRVSRLVQIFDSAPDYGEHHDLSVESIHNVCSLLKKYLHDLPEPVLDERVYRLFLAGCVDSTNPLPRRVASAQIILRLLPTVNFSLLVYLVAFLSQAPLFPSNSLSLDVVSEIFATSIMAPRSSSSSASASKKPAKAQMIITGPTDLVDDQGGKKANQALAWLLKNWSAIADGLLEPDFDVDVDFLLTPASPVSPTQTASPHVDTVVQQSPRASASPLARHFSGFEVPATPRPAPTPPTRGFETFPPSVPVPPVHSVPALASPIVNEAPKHLDTLEDEDETPMKSEDEEERGEEEEEEEEEDEDTNDSSAATKTPRPQSGSSYATSIETPPAGETDDRRDSVKVSQEAQQITPVDERGPLDPGHTDDVVEFDDYSSVYSFPAPPTSIAPSYQNQLPFLPPSPFLTQEEIALALAEQDKAVASATIPQCSTFAPLDYDDDEDEAERTEDLDVSTMSNVPHAVGEPIKRSPRIDIAEFEPKRNSISKGIAAPHLVRSKSIQLEESKVLISQQRNEIQSLWEKLSTLEGERVKEREQMAELAREVQGFKADLRKEVEATDAGVTKTEESEGSSSSMRTELEQVREELRKSEEERTREGLKAKEQVDSLEKQLAEIRKVLVPLLGSGIQL